MPSLTVFHHLRFQDFLDILILSFFAYHLYMWFHQTKAFKAMVGLLGLGMIYSVAQIWGLFLTTWVFQIFWQVLIILIIILFQSEIRQVLERVNPFYALGWKKTGVSASWIENFAKAAFDLGAQQIGALILFERKDRLKEFISEGIPIEADPTNEILFSIFEKHSPLHDGAMLVHNGRITMVSAFLPLTSRDGVSKEFGTRHRAAIGITERCDAWAVVVSEERGSVSLAIDGAIEPIPTSGMLATKLSGLLAHDRPELNSFLSILKHFGLRRWKMKLATLAIVSIVWFSFAGQQDVEVSIEVPLSVQNLAPELTADAHGQLVTVTARGQRKDIGMLSPKNVRATLDLSHAKTGKRNYDLTRRHLSLPNDRIEVIKIDPMVMALELKPKMESDSQ
jgi:uncharacterized protein (TIGR00159 family)